MSTHYPVLIPTLNRYEHLKRCIESLSRNSGASETELIIGLDYPPAEKYWDGYQKIKDYIPTISGFKNVIALESDHNLNAVKNSRKIHDYAQSLGYDAFIYTEDDNEFSENFLEYMNWALHEYANDDSIFSVCSYNQLYGINIDCKNNVYKTNRAYCAWGVGHWFKKEENLSQYGNLEYTKSWLDELPIITLFTSKVFLASACLRMIKENYILCDTLIQLLPPDKKFSLYPTVSKTRNWGHDGSGIHGGNAAQGVITASRPIDMERYFTPIIENPLENTSVDAAFHDRYGHKSIKSRIMSMFTFGWYKITGKIIIITRPSLFK